jgi:hypothetical protein
MGEETPINIKKENKDESENEMKIKNEEEEEIIEEVPLRRLTRVSQPLTKMRDYVIYKVKYAIKNFIFYKNFIKEYRTYLTLIENNEPNIFEEAIHQKIWHKAMKKELQALEKK